MSQATPASDQRIRGACPCGKKYSIKASLAGRRAHCKCGQLFTVPSAEELQPKVICSICGVKHRSVESLCRRCRSKGLTEASQSGHRSQAADPEQSTAGNVGVQELTAIAMLVAAIAATLIAALSQSPLNAIGFLVFFACYSIAAGLAVRAVRWAGGGVGVFHWAQILAATSCGLLALVRLGFTMVDVSLRDPTGMLFALCAIGPAVALLIANIDRLLRLVHHSNEASLETDWWKDKGVQFGVCLSLLIILIAGVMQTQLNGPDFIVFYLVLGLLSGGTLLVMRLSKWSPLTFVLIILAFEIVGLLRYAWGMSQGMQQFALLFKLMFYGPIGILVIAHIDAIFEGVGNGGGHGSSSGSSCSIGSSCGGGGCGSGCGGCGGD